MNRLKKTCLVAVLLMFTLALVLSACATEETQVTVTFIVDGKTYKSVLLDKGAALTEIPLVPNKDNYAGGWDCLDFSSFDEDTTITAVYVKNVYSVVFMAEGEEIDRQTVAIGKEPTMPDIPEKIGYESEWSITDFSEIIDDKTVQAIYTPKAVRYTFRVLGSNYPQNILIVKNATYGVELDSVPAVPVREGYDGAWSIQDFKFNAVDTDVLAVYTKRIYNVTMIHEGYEGHESVEIKAEHGKTYESLSAGERDGYVFRGWYYDVACLDEVSFPVTVTESCRFYARWLKSNVSDVESIEDIYSFTLLEDGTYSVKLKGTASAEMIIPNVYKGAPVTVIEDNAFQNQTIIRKVVIPSEVKTIGKNAFKGCTGLVTLLFERNLVETIDDYAFSETAIDTVNLPFTLSKIGKHAFSNNLNLTNVNFTDEKESRLENIDDCAFYNCQNLAAIVLGKELSSVGDGAFENNAKNRFTFRDLNKLKKVGSRAFYGCLMLKDFNAENLTDMGVNAFGKCSSLSSLTIPGGNVIGTYFGTEHFLGSYSVVQKTRKLVEGEYVFKDGAFEYDDVTYYIPSSLITVSLTKAADALVEYAMYDCYTVRNININGALRTIGDYALCVSELTETTSMSSNVLNFVEGCLLEEIGDYAFYNRYALSVVSFPENLTIIGDYSFGNCTGLNSVYFADESSITKVGRCAFESTGWFNSLTRGVVYIGNVAIGLAKKTLYFEDTEISIKEGTTEISPYAFSEVVRIIKFVLPASVKRIGEYAFSDNNSILEIALSDGITEIGDGAFSSCRALKNINFPSTLTEIGEGVMYGCEKLTEMSVVGNDNVGKLFGTESYNESYSAEQETRELIVDEEGEPVLDTNGDKSYRYVPKTYYIPLSLIKIIVEQPETPFPIADYAFKNLSSISVISLPEGITEIGKNAFEGCTQLGKYSEYFVYAKKKAEEKRNGNALSPVDLALLEQNCRNEVTLTIPSTVIKIGENAFSYNPNLNKVVFSDGSLLEEIGADAFSEAALTSLEIPLSTVLLGSRAFYGNVNLSELRFEEGGDKALTIGDNCFANNTALVNVIAPDRLVSIGEGAFSMATSLVTFEFGEGSLLTEIGENAFLNDSSLSELTIPRGVVREGEAAISCINILNGAIGLRELTIYNEVVAGELFGPSSYERSYPVSYNGSTYYIPYALVTVNILGGKVKPDAFAGFSSLRSVLFAELTEIGDRAFYNCSNVMNVSLPGSLTRIGESAFENCSALVTVSMLADSKLTEIGERAFSGATSLINASLPSSLEIISAFLFYNCNKLTGLRMPTSYTEIGEYAFDGCTSLTRFSLSEELIRIGRNAFNNCSNCVFPFVRLDSLLEIAEFAFNNCTLLESINARNIERVGTFAFSGCSSLRELSVAANSTVGNMFGSAYYEGSYSVDQDGDYYVPSSLEVLHVSTAVDSIPSYAFKDLGLERVIVYPAHPPLCGIDIFEGIAEVRIFVPYESASEYNLSWGSFGHNLYAFPSPDEKFVFKLLSDDTYALSLAEGGVLSAVESLPDTYKGKPVSTIASAGFSGNSEIVDLIIPPSVVGIENDAFKGCQNLTSVVFESGGSIKYIGDDAFAYCPSLEEIELPESLETIGDYAFVGNREYNSATGEYNYDSSLTRVTFGAESSLVSIGDYAFANSVVLNSVSLPESLVSLGIGAFYRSGISSLSFSDESSLEKISDRAFMECINLSALSIPHSVKTIGISAFASCSLLKSVILVSGINKLDSRAFYNCSSLENLSFPDTLTAIGESSFRYCTGLKAISVPDGVSSLGNLAFADCTFLTNVSFENSASLSIGEQVFHNTAWYETVYLEKTDGVVYIDNIVYEYKGVMPNDTVLSLAAGTIAIAPEAFYGQTNLKGIILPSSVKEIGSKAFMGSGLSELTLNEGLIRIGSDAFKNTQLSSLTLPNTLLSIGGGAFEGLDLTSLSLPLEGELSVIGAYAFNNCELNSMSITLPDSVSEVGDYAFAVANNSLSLAVRDTGSLKKIGKYAFKGVNLDFAFPLRMTAIDDYAFADSKLGAITISSVIERIGAYAFSGAEADKISIRAAGSLLSIGDYAFANLSETEFDIEYQYYLESIGERAFYQCEKLKMLVGSTITIIGDGAFFGCLALEELTVNGKSLDEFYDATEKKLKKLYISLGIEEIEDAAYNGISSLEYVAFSSTIKRIGSEAFASCSSLDELSFDMEGNICEVGRKAFFDTQWENNLTEGVAYIGSVCYRYVSPATAQNIVLSDTTTYITDEAFKNSNIRSISLPSALTHIGDESFFGSALLTNVGIASNSKIAFIGDRAFGNCGKLASMTIPKTVSTLGINVLQAASSLVTLQIGKNIAVPPLFGTENYTDSYAVDLLSTVYYVPSKLTEVRFLDGATDIPAYALANMISLKTVNIMAGVKTIGDYAFYNCVNLQEAIMLSGNDLETIGDYAFALTALKSVLFTNTVTTIGEGVLSEVVTLENMVVGGSYLLASLFGSTLFLNSYVVERDGKSYYLPVALTNVSICEGTEEIIDFAFANLRVRNISIPNTVKTIGDSAFMNNDSLKSVVIDGETLEEIGANAFSRLGIMEEITLPSTVRSIGDNCFEYCIKLETINYNGSINDLGHNAFLRTKWLEEKEDGAVYFGTALIDYVGSMDANFSFTPKPGTTSISNNVFAGYTQLSEFTFISSIQNIGEGVFADCSNLVSVKFEEGSHLSSIPARTFDGCAFSQITLPLTVDSIGDYAFRNCSALMEVNIRSNVASIGISAFEGTRIARIDLPLTLKTIGDRAFFGITALLSVNIPEDSLLETIGASAFEEAAFVSLSNVVLNKLTFIGENAFRGCVTLTSITAPNIKTIGNNAFSMCSSLTTLSVVGDIFDYASFPSSLENYYLVGARYFPEKLATLIVANGTKTIEDGAYSDFVSLESVVLPSGLVSIGENAFKNCNKLERVYFSEGLEEIGSNAFYGTALTDIAFPASLSKIYAAAFADIVGNMTVAAAEGSSLSTIGENAFGEIEGSFDLGELDNLIEIGADAFKNCTGLTELSARNVRRIGLGAFSGCENIVSVTVVGDTPAKTMFGATVPTTLKNVYVSDITTSLGDDLFADMVDIESVTLKNTTRIGNRSFAGIGLTSLTLPSGVIIIGDEAFKDCSNLSDLSFEENTLVKIGADAFDGCLWYENHLTNTDNGIINIGRIAYGYKGTLSGRLTIGEGTISIASEAFAGNDGLTEIIVPAGVINIGERAFYACPNVSKVTTSGNISIGQLFGTTQFPVGSYGAVQNGVTYYVPTSLKTIEIISGSKQVRSEAMANITTLTTVAIPISVVKIGEDILKNCYRIDTLSLGGEYIIGRLFGTEEYPESYSAVQNGVTYYLPNNLQTLSINSGAKRITDYAYQNAVKIESITLPDSIERIGKYAFAGCTMLYDLHIPTSLKEIADYAFLDCSRFSAIAVPCGITLGKAILKGAISLQTLSTGGGIAVGSLFGTESYAGSYSAQQGTSIYYIPGILLSVTITDTANISNYCMANMKNVTDVILSEDTVKIGNYSFSGITALKRINIPSNVTNIGKYAFYNAKLADFTFEKMNNISVVGEYSFAYCENLTEFSSRNITSIGESAFNGCKGMETLGILGGIKLGVLFGQNIFPQSYRILQGGEYYYIPLGLKSLTVYNSVSIADHAFSGIDSLNEIIFAEAVESIGSYAFENCSQLKEIELSAELTRIGEYAFIGCSALASVDFSTLNKLDSVGQYAFSETAWYLRQPQKFVYLNNWLLGYSGTMPADSRLEIRGGTDRIADKGMYNLSNLVGLTIPNSFDSLPENALSGCTGIKSLSIPFIGSDRASSESLAYLFDTLPLIEELTISDAERIAEGAMENIASLKKVTVLDGVLSIGSRALATCGALLEVTLPITVETMGEEVFNGCYQLTKLEIPFLGGTIDDSENNFFGYSFGLPKGASPSDYAIKEVVVTNENVIGEGAFRDFQTIKSLRLESEINEIGDDAFNGLLLEQLEDDDVRINLSGLYALADNAFRNAFVKEEVALGQWEDSELFTYLSVQATEKNKVKYLGYIVVGCETARIENVTLEVGTSQIYTFKGTSGVTEGAFAQAIGLKSIVIMAGLVKISPYAFNNCTSLTSISLPMSLEYIGNNAFDGCTKLSSVSILDNVKEIGENAFLNCPIMLFTVSNSNTNYKTLDDSLYNKRGTTLIKYASGKAVYTFTIPNEVTRVEPYAFSNSGNLFTLTAGRGLQTIGENALLGCTSLATFTVSAELAGMYGATSLGCLIINRGSEIRENALKDSAVETLIIGNTVSAIGDEAFAGCSKLRSVTFEATPEGKDEIELTIGNSVFKNCIILSGDSAINLPTRLASIGSYVFSGCTALIGVILPESITVITEGLFAETSSMIVYNVPLQITEIQANAFKKSDIRNISFAEGSMLETIGASAFEECSDLVGITMPEGLTTLGERAFYGCDSLQNVSSLGNISRINASTFSGCESLVSVNIPSRVDTIGNSAFEGCLSLPVVNLPSSLITLNASAFLGINSLKVYINKAVPPTFITETSFNVENVEIYVPTNNVDEYKLSWSYYEDRIFGYNFE